ncbi:MAG TPA: hypothetical protein VGX92_00040 [Pyrinomonadaceae bacterium]|jgi:hypothetical protein|nr:hypothetical protein [Pyrinomonadaceae bacterium]
MKIRRSTVFVNTLVIMTLALTGAACNSTSTNSNGGAGSANNANASNTRPAATNATPAAATSSSSASLSTPTNTFMAFYEASKKNDVEGVKRTLSKDTLDFLTAAAKEQKKTLEEALTESLKKADVPTSTPEVRNEKIDGDKATLEIRDEKLNRWETFNFARENGDWKVKLGAE